MYRISVMLVFILLHISSCATPARISKNLDSLFQYCYENELFNGHVLVYKKGDVIFNKSYGSTSHQNPVPLTENTAFRLASLSKQFTATAIMDLSNEGLLNYDDPVSVFLADFPYKEVTIRHLLNHTSGIPDYQPLLNKRYTELLSSYENDGVIIGNSSIAKLIRAMTPSLEFQPGTDFNYSNTGYVFLALIVEKVSKQSFNKYLRTRYFEPLGMINTWVHDSTTLNYERATGYKKNFVSNKVLENEAPAFLQVSGDGGIYSSANDLQRWFLALDSGEVVDAETLQEAYTLPSIGDEEGPYGFGWFVRKLPFNGNQAVTHSGEFAGFSNAVFRDLDAGTFVIVLSNNSNKIRSAINSAVVRILYGLPFDLPKMGADMALSEMLKSGDIELAKAFYKEHSENELYDFSEAAFNRLGYELLRTQRYVEAIAIFRWNVDLNPDSANVYDSLAEAYLESEDNVNALKYYKKAYEMDSGNDNAKRIIEILRSK